MDILRTLTSYMLRLAGVTLCLFMLTGCGNLLAFRQWMYNQPKAIPFRESEFFADGRSMRPIEPGTVASGTVQYQDDFFTTGLVEGQEVDALPFPITREVLDRGQQQYNVYCSPCHGLSGYGNGMVARRGGTPPANYHSDYIRTKPISHYYVVMTNGYRNMYSYASKITPEDRWAIAAYVRALQLSQNATVNDVPPDQMNQLQGMGQ